METDHIKLQIFRGIVLTILIAILIFSIMNPGAAFDDNGMAIQRDLIVTIYGNTVYVQSQYRALPVGD